jgi:putative oxidoreductase
MSGLTKIQSWSSTLSLFEYEYNVPVIPPQIAAYMATAGELMLPVMLVVGLFSRPAALGLFVLNLVAAISYPDISIAGEKDHIIWGAMLAVIFAFGPGSLSIDKLLSNRWKNG